MTSGPLIQEAVVFLGGWQNIAGIVGGAVSTGGVAAFWRTIIQRSERYAHWKAKRFVQRTVKPFQLEPVGKDVLTPNKRLEKHLMVPLLARTCGAMVLYAPTGMGKTTATRHVLSTLQSTGRISGALVVDCEDIALRMSEDNLSSPSAALRRHLFEAMRIPTKSSLGHSFSELLHSAKPRVVVCLDQFELLGLAVKTDLGEKKVTDEYRELRIFVTGLALDANQGAKYTVLINVADPELADEIVSWNGGQKITSIAVTASAIAEVDKPSKHPFAWEEAELHTAMKKYCSEDPRLKDLTEEDIKTACRDANGSIGALVRRREKIIEEMEMTAMYQGL